MKLDLHRHLDGNIRIGTILDMGRKHNVVLPGHDAETLRPYVTITSTQPGLLQFLEKFHWSILCIGDLEDCRRIAYENVEDAKNDGLDYCELRFSPWFMAESHQLPPEAVVEAVAEGVAQGERDFGVQCPLIGILSRTYGPEIAEKELAALLTHKEKLVAIDLAGDEYNFPPNLFVSHFNKARDAGMKVTIHAGEAGGAPGVWDAIKLLGATRIGHCVRAEEDPALMDYLLEHEIGIECNLTSNVQTSTVPNYASHPMKRFLDRGLLATLNTDDPAISGIDMRFEIATAAPEAGLSAADVEKAMQNAEKIAFAPIKKK